MMSLIGVGGCLSSLALPKISDRFGRRQTVLAGIGFALFTPAALLFTLDQLWLMPVGIALGSIALGCPPLYIAIIPRESVRSDATARAIALVSASSAVIGGVVAPAIGGKLADSFGLSAIFWLAGCLALLGGLVATQLSPGRHADDDEVSEGAGAAVETRT